MAPAIHRECAKGRSQRYACIGRRREPAQRLGALIGSHRIRDVGLDDADRAATRTLHEAREKEEPERVCVCEDDVGECGSAERLPFRPAASRNAPMLAASPMQIVFTGDFIHCIVS